jgi:hypothetical protein
MAVRTAGGDDHAIGDARLVGQVDTNDVLGLVVFETGQNKVFQTGGGKIAGGLVGGRIGLGRVFVRGLRVVGAQLDTPRAANSAVTHSTKSERGR